MLFIIGQQPDVVDIVSYNDPEPPYHFRMANARLLLTWARYLSNRRYHEVETFWVKNVKVVAKGGAAHALGSHMAPGGYRMFSWSSRLILAKNNGKQTESWAVVHEVQENHPGDVLCCTKMGRDSCWSPKTTGPSRARCDRVSERCARDHD
ncbi:hypothetical protein IFM46972_07442 [Aspergillus udagawae]|uniref:Uncharacterized protein n=1 Tax=Aspergillus udagawae TaxID=91492 RepID=A0A8H3RXW0_9EURO|nr:hypothetical protein IFM46972_07442 [Aspergillus udagawae]